jgi:hypothetical protein
MGRDLIFVSCMTVLYPLPNDPHDALCRSVFFVRNKISFDDQRDAFATQ